MLTTDKQITTPDYWNKIYEGKNDNAKVDASNTIRPANPFDRFSWVASQAEGPNVLEVAAGHAHISKRIKAANPDWRVYASDQAEAAKKVARYEPYYIFNAYNIPFENKHFNTIIIAQALEYIEDLPRFLNEAKRVAEYMVCSAPNGIMIKWSQLYEFTPDSLVELFSNYGEVLHEEIKDDLLLYKLKFND